MGGSNYFRWLFCILLLNAYICALVNGKAIRNIKKKKWQKTFFMKLLELHLKKTVGRSLTMLLPKQLSTL